MSEYIKFGKQSNGVFVDSVFINKLMPAANGAYVKVYLYALMKAQSGEACTKGEIADRLGILESDVDRAFSYWQEAGAVQLGNGQITFTFCAAADIPQNTAASAAAQSTDITKRPDVGEAADALASNKALADMCMLAQDMLGKPLTAQDTSTLYWFYDALGLEPAAILILLEYCASRDKRSMKYIEKVAMSWHENGVKTMEQAEAHIKKEAEKGGYLNTIRKLMRITDRAFSHSEEEFLYKWRDEYGMGVDMVALAYEYCIIQISKPSFPYMDRILLRWKENGIHTVAQAEQDNASFKQRSAQSPQKPANGYKQPEAFREKTNHDELERMAWEQLNDYQKGDFSE